MECAVDSTPGLTTDVDEAPPSWLPRPPALFPPALVPLLRRRLGNDLAHFKTLQDDVLIELLTVAFFAGLETHEGFHHAVRVAFAGRLSADVMLPTGEASAGTPMLFYRWSTLRLAPDRAYCVSELVKLAVVTRDDRLFAKVELTDRGLRVVGLAREGQNEAGDPYLKVVSPRPGVLSVRRGHESVIEYERGVLGQGPRGVLTAPGRVYRALEVCAQKAGLGNAAMSDYLSTVRAIVSQMGSHGRGGILVVSGDQEPELPARASYRTPEGSSIAELLRYLAGAAAVRDAGERGLRISIGSPAVQLRRVLHGAFVREVERWVTELGAFTAMDGATVLDCGLGVRGFGVVLPVARDLEVAEAADPEASETARFHLSTRGTRHRAAATYASHCPGSVVFVASHDGPISCMLGDSATPRVLVWRLGSGELL